MRLPSVSARDALRNSAVWACRRLRADLVSTLPVDVFTRISGIQFERPKPAVLEAPGGALVRRLEWLYSSQQDLDTHGNAYGLIAERDAAGLPSRINLIPAGSVSVSLSALGVVTYRVGKEVFSAEQIWHERQYTVPGLPVGLSPITYAALSIAQGQSAQEFAVGWYTNATVPSGILKNTARDLTRGEAQIAKDSYKAAVAGGDVWVAGKAWEFSPMTASRNDEQFIATSQATLPDIARFMGVPADLIDAMVSGGSSVTYANIVQRNLQFLIMNLGPVIARREDALSFGLLPSRYYLKFNSDALLRMDPATVSTMFGQQVRDRLRTPSEVREMWNLQPFTGDQLTEFETLFPQPRSGQLV